MGVGGLWVGGGGWEGVCTLRNSQHHQNDSAKQMLGCDVGHVKVRVCVCMWVSGGGGEESGRLSHS